MKSEHALTAVLVAVAMILGGVATFFFVGKSEQQVLTLPTVRATSRASEKSPVAQFSMQFDSELDSAVAAAKAARVAGTVKALATTPDEFARELGKINFRLHNFAAIYEEPPRPSDVAFTMYSAESEQLTADLANLLSDESLLAGVEDGDPDELAHHQALLAGGALGLDDSVIAQIEVIIPAANAKTLPEGIGDRDITPEEEAEFGKKFDAMTAEIEAQIRPLLTPDQIIRLQELGPEQVLFGLSVE